MRAVFPGLYHVSRVAAFGKQFTTNSFPYPATSRYFATMSVDSGFPPPALRKLAEEVANILKERSETVSVAETAAGGLISASLLSVPGASKIYKGGTTLYTLESRIAFAGWTQENIKNYNGPTPKLVAGLADHVRTTLKGSTYTIGESGTAGPTSSGQGRNRQPGYVALAVSSEKGTYERELETGASGDNIREKNMLAFAAAGLQLLKDVLEGKAKL